MKFTFYAQGGKLNETFDEYLLTISRMVENDLREYLELSFFEQLEKVRNDIILVQESKDFHKPEKKKSQLLIIKFIDKIRDDLLAESEKIPYKDFVKNIEDKIRVLINAQIYSGQFKAYIRFLIIQSLIGNGTHILNLDYRQKLKAEFDLIQPSSFKAMLFEVLNPLFLMPTVNDDIVHFWTYERRQELLAKYNRLSIIIKNVRSELKQNKRKDRSLKTKLQNQYRISDEWINLVDSSENISDLALEWSLKEMNIENAMKMFLSLRKSKKLTKKDAL